VIQESVRMPHAFSRLLGDPELACRALAIAECLLTDYVVDAPTGFLIESFSV
jgi:hypothetical protein